MIVGIAGIVGGMGLLAILSRRTFLGVLVGMQLLFLGASLLFVLTGISSGARPQGSIFAFFIVFAGIAQMVGGYALGVRRFYQKTKVTMDDLRALKK